VQETKHETAQGRLEAAQRALKERREQAQSLQEQLLRSGEQQRAAQRQVTQLALRLEQAFEWRALAVEGAATPLMQQLARQRDEALAVAEEAELRASSKEVRAA
jgi:hypothetical protein